jgi:hypothetical protein
MSVYFFDLIVAGGEDFWTDELRDRVMVATGDEGNPGVLQGEPTVSCSGEFSDLKAALTTRISQVESCGVHVERVESLDESLLSDDADKLLLVNLMLRARPLIPSSRDLLKFMDLWFELNPSTRLEQPVA